MKLIMSAKGGWNVPFLFQRELAAQGVEHVQCVHPDEDVRMEFPEGTIAYSTSSTHVNVSIPKSDYLATIVRYVLENDSEYIEYLREKTT